MPEHQRGLPLRLHNVRKPRLTVNSWRISQTHNKQAVEIQHGSVILSGLKACRSLCVIPPSYPMFSCQSHLSRGDILPFIPNEWQMIYLLVVTKPLNSYKKAYPNLNLNLIISSWQVHWMANERKINGFKKYDLLFYFYFLLHAGLQLLVCRWWVISTPFCQLVDLFHLLN